VTYTSLSRKINETDALIAKFEDEAIARVEGAMGAAFRALDKELRRKWIEGESKDLAGKDRAMLMLAEIKDYLSLLPGGVGEVEDLYKALIADAAAAGVDFGAAAIDSIAGGDTGFVTAKTVKPNIKAVAYQAQDAAKRLYRHDADFQLRASKIIEQGLVQGASVAKVASALRREMGVLAAKAETIARTETMSAMDSAARDTYRQNGVEYVQRIGTQDKLICPFCAARVGNVYEVDKAPSSLHPRDRCLPGFVIVSSPSCPSATTRHYKGQVIVLETAAGNKLTCTPNHPILTDQGWVAAHLIDDTFNVVSCLDGEALAAIISPDDYHAPSPIGKIFAAISGSSQMTATTVEIAAEDFHGDGAGSKVGVVYSNSLLSDGLDPNFFEPDLKQLLGGRFAHSFFLFGNSGFLKLIASPWRCRNATHLDRSLFSEFRRHVCANNSVGLRLSSKLNPLFFQSDSNGVPTFPHGFGDLKQRFSRSVFFGNIFPERLKSISFACHHSFLSNPCAFFVTPSKPVGFKVIAKSLGGNKPSCSIFDRKPGNISLQSKLKLISRQTFLDRVVNVSCHDFCGDVFNLETAAGFYIASNIIVHNCYNAPWRKQWAELGLVDEAWLNQHKADIMARLAEQGKKPDYGLAPFERLGGALSPPKAIWSIKQ
jgi:SPP1 gp7 family putative phage head morphogenesis protein